jgi:hypothetical protein
VFQLPVELIGNKEGEDGIGYCEYIPIRCFDGFPIEGDEISTCGGCYLCRGCLLF